MALAELPMRPAAARLVLLRAPLSRRAPVAARVAPPARRHVRGLVPPVLACAASTPAAAPRVRGSLLGDVVAGVSVAFITIPQSLAYASLAGLGATQGLHTNAVASLPAAALSPSRYLQTGCVAMSSLLAGGCLVAAGLAPHTAEYASAAALLAAVVGVTRLALGLFNGGALIARLPGAVLEGFGLAVVWLVAAAQVPSILGAPAAAPGVHFIASAAAAALRPAMWQPGAVVMAAATLACVLGGKRVHPLFPGAIVATVLGCAAAAAGLPVGPTVGAVKASLPQLINPASLPWHLLPSLAPAGVAVALAGFAEAAAIARRVASDDGEEWNCNRELLSQGAANLAVAAFGGLPVAGSLSRTSLARTAGGTSQLAHAVTGIVVLAFLPAGAALLSWLPRAVLGGLVAAAMAPLMMPSPALLPNVPRTAASEWPRRDLALGWATAAATLAASPRLELGLQAGLALAAALAAWQAADRTLRQQARAMAAQRPPLRASVTAHAAILA